MGKLGAKSTVKRIVKDYKPEIRINDKAQTLLFLDYVLFLKRVTKEAENVAREEKSKVLLPEHVKKIRKKVLKSMKG